MVFSELFVLGSGTIVPLPHHGCAGYLLRAPGNCILMDCGPGTLVRLADAGVSASDVDTVLISHFHVDHVSDVAALLSSRFRLAQGARLKLEICGPAGMRDYLAWLGARMDPWFSDMEIAVREADGGPFEVGGLAIRAVRTGHTPEGICFRLEDDLGRVLFYSGDTDYNEALLPLARDADIALVECSMPDENKADGHLTPRLAARLAQRAGVRRLVLTHFYREVTEVDILARAGEVFEGRIVLAEDGMSIPFADIRETTRRRAES